MLILKSEIKGRADSVNSWICSIRYQNQAVMRHCFIKNVGVDGTSFALYSAPLPQKKKKLQK